MTDEPVARAAGLERHAMACDSVGRLLALLPADQRATLVLVDGEGFDNQTAAVGRCIIAHPTTPAPARAARDPGRWRRRPLWRPRPVDSWSAVPPRAMQWRARACWATEPP